MLLLVSNLQMSYEMFFLNYIFLDDNKKTFPVLIYNIMVSLSVMFVPL